jgi:hypothetical protein
MGSVPQADIGKASGTLSTARQLGSVFGVAVAVAIFQASGPANSAAAAASGISHAFALSAAASLAGALLSLAIVPRAAALLASWRHARPATS